MKKTIWKFDLQITERQKIEMPVGAEILTVQAQSDKPKLWAILEPSELREKRTFAIYGTGHDIEINACREKYEYLATFQIMGGFGIFHVFEIITN